MTRPILIKNAEVFAPEKLGRRDIVISGGRIFAMEAVSYTHLVALSGFNFDSLGCRILGGTLFL